MPAGSTRRRGLRLRPGLLRDDPRQAAPATAGSAAAATRSAPFYELYDTQGTLYDRSPTTARLIATSDCLFRNVDAIGHDDGRRAAAPPSADTRRTSTYGDGRDYHNRWYRLASGLTGGANGTVYRLHTTSTDPANVRPASSGPTARTASRSLPAPAAARRRYTASARCRRSRRCRRQGRPSSRSSTSPRSSGPRRQDGRDQALGSGRHEAARRPSLQILVPNAAAGRRRPSTYTAAEGTTNGDAANCNSAQPATSNSVRRTSATRRARSTAAG